MPDDDTMLGQNLVDVRNEERREYQRAHVFRDEQAAFCTNDENCEASPDGHEETCPVEDELRLEFGF